MSESVSRLATDLIGDLMRGDLLGGARLSLDGRYTLEKVLGRGATGVVVRARDQRLGRDVAIKLVPASATSRATLDEARSLAKLKRPPCVVQVWEVTSGRLSGSSHTGDLDYIVMELVVGVTLRQWRNARERTMAEVLAVYGHVAVGLSTVHNARIVHGDVKPDNIIVDSQGMPTLVDFGFAATVQRKDGGARRGSVVGTPPYMAPEAYSGQLRRKSDVHAYAVSLWEAITGALPFNGKQAPIGWFGVPKLSNAHAVPGTLRLSLRLAMHPDAASRPSIDELHTHVVHAGIVAERQPAGWWSLWWTRIKLTLVALALTSFALRHPDWVRPVSPGAANFLDNVAAFLSGLPRPSRPTSPSDHLDRYRGRYPR